MITTNKLNREHTSDVALLSSLSKESLIIRSLLKPRKILPEMADINKPFILEQITSPKGKIELVPMGSYKDWDKAESAALEYRDGRIFLIGTIVDGIGWLPLQAIKTENCLTQYGDEPNKFYESFNESMAYKSMKRDLSKQRSKVQAVVKAAAKGASTAR